MASRNGPPNSKPHPATRPCLCSPTTHPGSFRCSLHRNFDRVPSRAIVRPSSRQWQLEVMAKANSVKAFLLQIIKPSSHDLQRRRNFKPKPTRFCLMNGNRDVVAVSWSYGRVFLPFSCHSPCGILCLCTRIWRWCKRVLEK